MRNEKCNPLILSGSLIASLVLATLAFESIFALADDWPMRGQNVYRRSWIDGAFGPHIWESKTSEARETRVTSEAKQAIDEARKATVRWTAGGFYQAMCDPVVSDGLLWIGTADPIGPDIHDSGVLACFDAKSGELLYQHVSEKLGNADQDWSGTGNTSSPFIQGDRLWFCTTRLEVVCLNIQPLISRTGQPTVLWSVDFKDRFKITPKDVHLGNRASRCSIVGCDGRIFVNTTHSVSRDGKRADPDLPSFVCLDDKTGQPNDTMQSSVAGLCVTNEFVFASDGDGSVYCLNKSNGQMHWRHEMLATIIGTPLVVGDTLYVADEDGDLEVLRASRIYEHISSMNHRQPIESSPIYAEDSLFIVSRQNVFAIGK